MADECCDTIIGGEVYINAGDKRYEGLGEIRLRPRDIERTHGVTTAGKLWVVEEARAIELEMTFANRCESDPMDLFDLRCKVDVTIVEKSRGFRHMFTAASIIGWPEVNLSNGEVSNLRVVTDQYLRASTNPSQTGGNPGGVGV